MRTLDITAAAAAIAGTLLIAGCVTEGDITGTDDDPTAALLRIGGGGRGIIVMNGLNPEAYWHADVQSQLVDFLNEPLKGTSGAAATMGPSWAGQEFLPYAARGALKEGTYAKVPDGAGGTYAIKGEYGMANGWRTRALSAAEQEMNATYWAASLNAKDLPAEIAGYARYAPFDAPPPKDFDFFEGVFFVLWEGGSPRLHVAPSDLFFDLCGDAQLLVRGRCGNANPAACGLIGVNKPAESVCTFDANGAPISCTIGSETAHYPMMVLGNTLTCEE